MKYSVTAIIPTMLNDAGLFYLTDKLGQEKIPTIIIDNQPNPKKQLLAKKTNLVYLPQKNNLGFAAAINLGAKTAKTDWLLILNDDIELPKLSFRECGRLSLREWPDGLSWSDNFKQLLVALTSFAQKHDLVTVSPVLVNKHGRVENYGYRVLPYGKVELNLNLKNKNIDGLTAACLLIRRDIFLKLGGFDERFFAYLEDVEFFLRFKKRRYKMGISSIGVFHNHMTTTKSIGNFKARQDMINWWRLFFKHPDKFRFNLKFAVERLRNLSGYLKAAFFYPRKIRKDSFFVISMSTYLNLFSLV
jgi:GT2 family glycosyltransferase